MKVFKVFLMSFLVFFVTNGLAQNSVKFVSVEWPPFQMENGPEKGLTAEIVEGVFKKGGSSIKIEFMPWKRAVDFLEATNNDYMGIVALYRSDISDKMYASKVVLKSPIGLVVPKGKEIHFKKVEDLFNKTIITIDGYSNTPEIDKAILENKIKSPKANSDQGALEMLIAKRGEAAIMDRYVFSYYQARTPGAEKFVFEKDIIADLEFYIGFKKTEKGKELRDLFDQNLSGVPVENIKKKYLNLKAN